MPRDDYDDFFGDDDDQPVVDTKPDGRLLRIPLDRLSPNFVNPRSNFGSEDELIDFGKSLRRRQNQACPVVSKAAYLKIWPENEERIGDVDYVLVCGERRYRGATAVAMSSLDCVINDDHAQSRKTFLDAVVSENVDRRNFDSIEEAYAVQSLVEVFGTNRAVAQHFERADGWVTQRVLLTHLAPELQDLVRKKDIPVEVARTLGKLARDNEWGAAEQSEWWANEQARRTSVSAARAAAKKEAKAPKPRDAARAPANVPQRSAGAEGPSSTASPAESFTAVKPSVPDTAEPDRDPAAATGEGGGTLPEPRLPYDDPSAIARHLDRNLEEQALFELLRLLARHAQDRNPEQYRKVLDELAAGQPAAEAS